MEALDLATAPASAPGEARAAIVLAGFMGAGKSTAARTLAAELEVEPLDSDHELERELGEPLEAFFDREGEAAFRTREEEVVLRLLDRADARVVALGGGALASERTRAALRRHLVVHLDVDPETAWARASGTDRPLAHERSRFDQLHRDRRPLYESVADAVLPAGDRETPRRALPALTAVRDAPTGARLVWAASESGDYPVLFGPGALRYLRDLPEGGRRYVVTDSNVARLHPLAGDRVIEVPPGEEHKTLGRAEGVLRELADAGAERGDVVVAVGGGVVGDLAGFCAAVYQRGIRHAQVPTTVVGQVDSAYGGKTGVDLPEAKNYVGAFHQPSAVFVDPALLESLPPRERSAGYAEVVKTALIAGGPLWARVRSGAGPDAETILGCLRTKLAIVAEDERDEGRRQVLNLGHTVGHALEAATGYGRYRHGEAVGIGLLAALRLSDREALREEVAGLLAAHGLPTRFEGATVDDVVALVARDKKRRVGLTRFVLVEAPGAVTPGHEVEAAALEAAIRELRA